MSKKQNNEYEGIIKEILIKMEWPKGSGGNADQTKHGDELLKKKSKT